MKIAIVGGTGDQGIGLALRLAKAGEEIIIGSRDEKKAENVANSIRDILKDGNINIQGKTNSEAAELGDLVIMTVPLQAQMGTIFSVKDNVEDKILVDATVPLDTCIGGKPVRYVNVWEGSAAERTAEFLKNKRTIVISAFNNISAASLNNVENDVDCDCLISGDDDNAKLQVMQLAEKIPGVRAIDCGPLENARIVEKITPLLINLNIKNKIKSAGIRITSI